MSKHQDIQTLQFFKQIDQFMIDLFNDGFVDKAYDSIINLFSDITISNSISEELISNFAFYTDIFPQIEPKIADIFIKLCLKFQVIHDNIVKCQSGYLLRRCFSSGLLVKQDILSITMHNKRIQFFFLPELDGIITYNPVMASDHWFSFNEMFTNHYDPFSLEYAIFHDKSDVLHEHLLNHEIPSHYCISIFEKNNIPDQTFQALDLLSFAAYYGASKCLDVIKVNFPLPTMYNYKQEFAEAILHGRNKYIFQMFDEILNDYRNRFTNQYIELVLHYHIQEEYENLDNLPCPWISLSLISKYRTYFLYFLEKERQTELLSDVIQTTIENHTNSIFQLVINDWSIENKMLVPAFRSKAYSILDELLTRGAQIDSNDENELLKIVITTQDIRLCNVLFAQEIQTHNIISTELYFQNHPQSHVIQFSEEEQHELQKILSECSIDMNDPEEYKNLPDTLLEKVRLFYIGLHDETVIEEDRLKIYNDKAIFVSFFYCYQKIDIDILLRVRIGMFHHFLETCYHNQYEDMRTIFYYYLLHRRTINFADIDDELRDYFLQIYFESPRTILRSLNQTSYQTCETMLRTVHFEVGSKIRRISILQQILLFLILFDTPHYVKHGVEYTYLIPDIKKKYPNFIDFKIDFGCYCDKYHKKYENIPEVKNRNTRGYKCSTCDSKIIVKITNIECFVELNTPHSAGCTGGDPFLPKEYLHHIAMEIMNSNVPLTVESMEREFASKVTKYRIQRAIDAVCPSKIPALDLWSMIPSLLSQIELTGGRTYIEYDRVNMNQMKRCSFVSHWAVAFLHSKSLRKLFFLDGQFSKSIAAGVYITLSTLTPTNKIFVISASWGEKEDTSTVEACLSPVIQKFPDILKEKVVILADEGGAIEAAVRKCLPNAKLIPCAWHVQLKFPKPHHKLSALFWDFVRSYSKQKRQELRNQMRELNEAYYDNILKAKLDKVVDLANDKTYGLIANSVAESANAMFGHVKHCDPCTYFKEIINAQHYLIHSSFSDLQTKEKGLFTDYLQRQLDYSLEKSKCPNKVFISKEEKKSPLFLKSVKDKIDDCDFVVDLSDKTCTCKRYVRGYPCSHMLCVMSDYNNLVDKVFLVENWAEFLTSVVDIPKPVMENLERTEIQPPNIIKGRPKRKRIPSAGYR